MMSTTRPIPKVLVASNSLTTGPGPLWAPIFEAKSFKVIQEPNLANVINSWMGEIPDLIVFDITPLDDKALCLIEDLRQGAAVPILLLTACQDKGLILRAYAAGVDDCILKPIEPAIFHAKLRAWLRSSWIVPLDALDSIQAGKLQLIPSRRIVIMDDQAPILLTNLEMRLLYILMSRPDRPIQTDDLINKVWGLRQEADVAALKNVAYRLRRKIEADPARPRMILNVMGSGYMFHAGS